jgi:Na+-driven multidrug efflux pump
VLLVFIHSLNAGVTAVVARRKGEGNAEGARLCMNQALTVCVFLAALLSFAGMAFAAPVLLFSGAQAAILQTRRYTSGLSQSASFLNAISLTINAAQRGTGNTKVAMRANVSANLVNLLLIYLLITGRFGFPALGVRGAAIATVIGNGVGMLVSISSIVGKNAYLRFSFAQMRKFTKQTLAPVFMVSVSALLHQLL